MKERIKKAHSKKAFTLVELVIVIAILSILAAIAIPVITTTINSSKYSVMESNSATVEMLIKEAVNTMRAEINTTYNGTKVKNASVEDVLVENSVDLDVMEVKTIGGLEYAIYWDTTEQGTSIHSGTAVAAYDLSTKLSSLD